MFSYLLLEADNNHFPVAKRYTWIGSIALFRHVIVRRIFLLIVDVPIDFRILEHCSRINGYLLQILRISDLIPLEANFCCWDNLAITQKSILLILFSLLRIKSYIVNLFHNCACAVTFGITKIKANQNGKGLCFMASQQENNVIVKKIKLAQWFGNHLFF